MTPRIKERVVNGGISFLTAVCGVVLGFALSSGDAKAIRINQELKEKAPYEYVDKQDGVLRCDIDELKADTEKDIETLTNTINTRFDDQDDKLDIMIKLIEK